MNDSEKRYLQYLRNLRLAEATGCLHSPQVLSQLSASLSPLRQGQIAARAGRQLERNLFRRMVAVSLAGETPASVPKYDPRISFPLAKVVGTDSMLSMLLDAVTGHCVWSGATGAGKTCAQVRLSRQVDGAGWDSDRGR
jgi:hypothetical protein